jgi:uncharacterized SAM-binding protein YcdF (DUF218 family)
MSGASSPIDPTPRRHRWRWVLVSLTILIAAFFVWVLLAGRILVHDQTPIAADAVVVLSGDPLGDRLRSGVDVFLSTGSSRLIAFTEFGKVYDQRAATLRFLAHRGVPVDQVRLLPSGSSTAEEAGVIGAYADACHWGSLDVVTSPFHTRRAGILFSRATGDVQVATVSADQPYDAARWWGNPRDREVTLIEWVKLVASVGSLVSAPAGTAPAAPC